MWGILTAGLKILASLLGMAERKQFEEAGRAKQRGEQLEETFDDVEKAKAARDELRDSDERERVRRKFTRK